MLNEVILIESKVFKDERGLFKETWNQKVFNTTVGKEITFKQDNISVSKKGVFRGLHFQSPQGQGKLVTVLKGSVMDIVVDVSVGSPTFGKYSLYCLSEENHRQVFIPPGFAHGFLALEDCVFSYKCTEFYDPKNEFTLLYDLITELEPFKEVLNIKEFIVSKKDLKGKRLKDFTEEELPKWIEKQF